MLPDVTTISFDICLRHNLLMQRTGNKKELLGGPALYGLSHVILTVVAWRSNPAGAAGIAALCAGRHDRCPASVLAVMQRCFHDRPAKLDFQES